MTAFASDRGSIRSVHSRISRRPNQSFIAIDCLVMIVLHQPLGRALLSGPMPGMSSVTSVDSTGIQSGIAQKTNAPFLNKMKTSDGGVAAGRVNIAHITANADI